MKKFPNNLEYIRHVDKVTPNSPVIKNCFNAFWSGGLICAFSQFLIFIFTGLGFEKQVASNFTLFFLILLTAILTGLNIFNRIGKTAGAGTLIPITGFANSIVSPAMEYKSEGYIMGVGAKMFIVAGPVLVYGISTSIFLGIIYFFLI